MSELEDNFFTIKQYYHNSYLVCTSINELLKLTEKYQANVGFLQYNGIYIQVLPLISDIQK